jgi:hypothetical protein
VDAQRNFPSRDIPLETTDSVAYFQKMEVHKGIYWYTTDLHSTANLIAVPVQRVREIQALNKKGVKADRLIANDPQMETETVSEDLLENNSLTRFDPAPAKGKHHKHSHKKNRRFHDKRNK